MKYPNLKNALLCRILVYVIVLGGFILPIIICASIDLIPDEISIMVFFVMTIGLLVYIFKNFALLMYMDIFLATLHCHNTARKKFDIDRKRIAQKIESRISRFGKKYAPAPITPVPDTLRYKFSTPITIYSSGIEKVVMTYHVGFLDVEAYRAIFRSADTNSKALIGKKKAILLDKSQKESGLNRATVAIIFASRMDDSFREVLFDTVCKQGGDGFDRAILPCVIDLEKEICIFDSERLPYYGFQYPVKNRGIRLIRKFIFGGKLPLKNNPYTLVPIKDADAELSLWKFWHTSKKELILDDIEQKKRYKSMSHKQIIFEDDYLYIKWEDRGIWLAVELDEETKTAKIDPITSWHFPKANSISKRIAAEVQKLITDYFDELGYSSEFIHRA